MAGPIPIGVRIRRCQRTTLPSPCGRGLRGAVETRKLLRSNPSPRPVPRGGPCRRGVLRFCSPRYPDTHEARSGHSTPALSCADRTSPVTTSGTEPWVNLYAGPAKVSAALPPDATPRPACSGDDESTGPTPQLDGFSPALAVTTRPRDDGPVKRHAMRQPPDRCPVNLCQTSVAPRAGMPIKTRIRSSPRGSTESFAW